MNDFVTALTAGITPEALWTAVSAFAGLVVVMILFNFGYTRLRRVISGAGKGKAKI